MLLAILAGCASAPHLMPTPVLLKDERLNFMPTLPAELHSTHVQVFYATRRAPAAPGEPAHYVNAPGEGTTLGVAEVRLGDPGWSWDQLLASDRVSTVDTPRPGAFT
jgi:hypothetical protein